MINGRLDQFLDTGWYSEATLYYHGFIYWCEAQFNAATNITSFFVDKWAAKNEDNTYYHPILEENGTVKWERVFETSDNDLECIKKRFLEACIFDGKSFWQIEKELAWLEESTPIST
ncbi:MAG: hypothetical protein MJ099_02905 [Clostridia bacterium]|nr:hypothetical protein [Clostridia bacterium]